MIKKHKRLIAVISAIAAIGAAYVLFGSRFSSLLPKATATGDGVVVTPKTLVFGVDATGLLRATQVQNFGGPPPFGNYWQFQIVNMITEGKQVKAGEQLITFDAQRIRDDLMRFQNELDQAVKELEKTRTQIDLEGQELKTKLAAAENNYEKLKLKQERDMGVEAFTKVENDRLAFEQARREVEAIKERIEWHKKSSEATYQIIVSKKTRAENKVNEIKKGMENFQAKADRDGVVIYKIKWNGEKFRVGESVWTGLSLLEIPDLNTIVAEAYIPEVDIGKIKPGQSAEVTIDAFPDKVYTGSIKSLGKLVHPKAWDIPNKILDIQIALDQLDISIMRPSMSVKAKIKTSSIENCLAVPLKAIRTTAEGSMIKVKTDQGWREQPVKLGESNGTEVVILEGLNAGDRIGPDFAKAK
ncbi:MAG TPA: efflux RND transporter periplasmic adaptor subunit [Blastocatellia bacterium]|jgi:multidrug efflux pump subunit AcrA (membrane-fusion protein)|nr:efflux RND transporter periplasmic adaptor subunit [Blastocatellia bacterium]